MGTDTTTSPDAAPQLMPPPILAALIRACYLDWGDDFLKLVLADYLDEHGPEDWGRFIRLSADLLENIGRCGRLECDCEYCGLIRERAALEHSGVPYWGHLIAEAFRETGADPSYPPGTSRPIVRANWFRGLPKSAQLEAFAVTVPRGANKLRNGGERNGKGRNSAKGAK